MSANALTGALHPEALVRITAIVGDRARGIPPLVPVSRSGWYAGVKDGRFPPPLKLGSRTAVWRLSDVLAVANPRP
jgi:prophage regulatory protein